MDFDEYQEKASRTDQYPSESGRGESISLFGLIGEIGSLLTTFKKRLRDKEAYKSFRTDLCEELGDVLWYLSNLAKKYHISLDEIAHLNLEKTRSLWGVSELELRDYQLYDDGYPTHERLPRQLQIAFDEAGEMSDAGFARVRISVEDKQLGDSLTDNAYDDDGYRYHDCFHLAYAAILGWSPVLRRARKCKRKSAAIIDEIEDGARAVFTEEFITLYVYNYAKNHNYLEGTDHIDTEVLRTIKNLAQEFEVGNRYAYEWRTAIVKACEIFRLLRANNGGVVKIDLCHRKIEYCGK